MKRPLLALMAFVASLAPSMFPQGVPRAQEAQSDPAFSLERFGDGYLRINRETGAVSFCRLVTGNLVCRVAAEEREAYEDAITRLETRLERIERRLAEAESKLGIAVAPPEEENPDRSVADEVDRAFEFADRAMRRFFESVKEMKKELENDRATD